MNKLRMIKKDRINMKLIRFYIKFIFVAGFYGLLLSLACIFDAAFLIMKQSDYDT